MYNMYCETCLVRTSKGTQNQYTYYQRYLLSGLVYVCMRYTRGQNEEYLLSGTSIYVLNQVLILSKFQCTLSSTIVFKMLSQTSASH